MEMRTDFNKADVASSAARPLTICVIGPANSVHVAARARCFADLGQTVLLVTGERSRSGIAGVSEHAPAPENARAGNLARRLLAPAVRALGMPPGLSHLPSLVRFLQKNRPDVVHVHFAQGYYAWLAGLIGCRPLVVSVMGGDILFDEQGTHNPTTRWLTVELLRQADYITSKSHYLTSVLDQLGGFGAKTERVIWGVPMSRFHRTDCTALRTRLGIDPGRRIVMSPRILQPLYRIHLLVEAMPLIVREIPEAVLLVTEHRPDPVYRAQIVRRVHELGLGKHVAFCGDIGHEEMPALYSLAEVSVGVPSSDGLPQTLLEAMACETPSILSRLPRYEEIVRHEHSAYFVDATPDAIAAGVIRLLSDPLLRSSISRNALEIVAREGDLDEAARRVLQRYRELASSVPARAFSLSRCWRAWRSFRRFRASLAAQPVRRGGT